MRPRNKASPRYIFIWDLDDTLIWTSWAYSRVFSKFYEYMLQLFDYRLIELRTLGTISEEIDKALMKEINPKTKKPYGYSMERFPTSLVRTYQWLCDHGYSKYQEMVARRVKILGMEVFDPLCYKQQGLVRGAENALNFLKAKDDMQILITKGERLVQEYKVVALELERWFGEEIHISDTKNAETFKKYVKRFGGSSVYSIGNSFTSDILPALEAGASAIFIPYYTWLGESVDLGKLPTDLRKRLYEIKEINQIIDIYDRL